MRGFLTRIVDYLWAAVAVVLSTCARSKHDDDNGYYK